jgi:CIC family chloride channel protein
MGAVFSGAIRAPMTSVLIIVEMTSGYELILPLMIANMSAFLIARRFKRRPIYESLLAQDGISFEEHELGDAVDRLLLCDLVRSDRAFVTFERHVRAPELLRIAHDASWQTVFPVIDRDGGVIGIITVAELRILAAEPDLLPLTNAADVMRPSVPLTVRDTLRRALERMRVEGVRELPVLDDNDRVTGFIDEGALAHFYLTSTPTPPSSRRG